MLKLGQAIQKKLTRYNVVNDRIFYLRHLATNFSSHQLRKKVAKPFLESNQGRVKIDPALGYTISHASELEGLNAILPGLKEFATKRLSEISPQKINALRNDQGGYVKTFFFNLLNRDHLLNNPDWLNFGLSKTVMEVLVPYYGTLPYISHMAVFASGICEPFNPGDSPRGTQRLHYDNRDLKHVKMFCYLDDVTEDDGPFTLLNIEQSTWLRKKTGRLLRTSPFHNDAEFLKFFDKKDLKRITGPAGTVAFIDTTSCAHFGSRCNRDGRRLAYVIHYTTLNNYSLNRSRELEDLNLVTSPELLPIVKKTPWSELLFQPEEISFS